MTDQVRFDPLPGTVNFGLRDHWPFTLRAGELVLRPIRPGDRQRWEELKVVNAYWTTEWDATQPPETTSQPRSFAAWARQMNRAARRGEILPWAIAIDSGYSGRTGVSRLPMVGQITVSGIAYGSVRSAEIGYWIDHQYAGRGYMPRAVALAGDFCFRVLRLHRVEIAIRPENARSLRVVDKLAFREEGLRPAYLHVNGAWRDHRVFALNAEEAADGLVNRLRW